MRVRWVNDTPANGPRCDRLHQCWSRRRRRRRDVRGRSRMRKVDKERISSIERAREGQRGILTNWKAVKAKAPRSLILRERKNLKRKEHIRARERENELVGEKTSRATLVSGRASQRHFQSRNKVEEQTYTVPLGYPLGARRKTQVVSLLGTSTSLSLSFFLSFCLCHPCLGVASSSFAFVPSSLLRDTDPPKDCCERAHVAVRLTEWLAYGLLETRNCGSRRWLAGHPDSLSYRLIDRCYRVHAPRAFPICNSTRQRRSARLISRVRSRWRTSR